MRMDRMYEFTHARAHVRCIFCMCMHIRVCLTQFDHVWIFLAHTDTQT